MNYFFELNLDVEPNNIVIPDGYLGDWRYLWSGSKISALTVGGRSVNKEIHSTFEELESPRKLGYLVDVLCFCSDLTISSKIAYVLFGSTKIRKADVMDREKDFLYASRLTRSQKALHRGSSSDEWPVRVKPKTSHTYNPQKLKLVDDLLVDFSNIKANTTGLKLLNYWRRGFDLENLWYWDESFLAFFKILEYFASRYKKSMSPQIDQKIGSVSDKSSKKALKMIGGAGYSKADKFLTRVLSEAVVMRNRFDIAHMRIRPLPEQRQAALYFTYYDDMWDLHDHLKEIARIFIMRFLGIKGYVLKADGGLLALEKMD